MQLPLSSRRRALIAGLGALSALAAACGEADDAPTVTAAPGAPTIPVTLSDAGCSPSNFTVHPGTVVFQVTNHGSSSVKEMEVRSSQGQVMGDAEGVEPGDTKTFVVDLTAGKYEVHCPQSAPTGGYITVG